MWYVLHAIIVPLIPYQRFLKGFFHIISHENSVSQLPMLAQVIFSKSALTLPPRQWLAHETQSKHNGGDHKEKACCDAFVCEQRKSPHYTNLFSLVHSQDTISGLQSFSNSSKTEITRGKRSQLLLFFLFTNNPSILQQGHSYTHIQTVNLSIYEKLID